MALGMEVGLGPGHVVLDGEPAHLPKKGAEPRNSPPIFIMAKRLDKGLRPFIQLPPEKRAHPSSPQFSANTYCGQTAGWTKMPIGMEVGLGLGDFVLDWDPATPRKRAHLPSPHPILAHVYCGQTGGWIKMPLAAEVNVGPGNVVSWGRSSP